MRRYIDKAELISHTESEYRKWGDDYDAEQILGDIEDMPAVEMVPRFIDDYTRGKQFATEYSAGVVREDEDGFYIGYEQIGARETFSVGQPVYDGDKHLMGYLGIGLFMHLDYAANIRIPVERWMICLPTRNCKAGKNVYTYWQTTKREKEGEQNG